MKKLAAITLTSMMLLLATAMVVGAVESVSQVEVRGAVAGTVNGASNLAADSFSWNPQTFAGFYYDIKKDLGNEKLTFTLTGEGDVKNKLSGDDPRGVLYTTSTQNKAFERDLWGSYKIIGFQAERYFAGYNQGNTEEDGSNIFFKQTTDKNSLNSEQLEKILMDSKDEMTVTSGTPLKLGAGYELAIKAIDIDGNKVYVELSKDGQVIDSKVVSPSKTNANELDKTYYYKKPKVGEQTKLVIIGVHFKNAFRGADQNLASIDGIWQISDEPTEVKADTSYGKMTIKTVSADNIIMDNKDNAITLSKNKNTELMPGVNIKTADNDTLRFYIYKLITEPGDYQIRGTVAGTVNGESNLATDSFSWDPQTFAGFFYDIKKDLGNEKLTFTLTGEGDVKNKLSGDDPRGVLYTTNTQNKAFERDLWGSYKVIGFQAEKFFAGYNQGNTEEDGSNIFFKETTDKNSLNSEQLEKILMDSKDEMTVTSGTPLKLGEGYELAIKSIDIDGNKVYVELSKDGQVINAKVVSPSKDNANELDKTYYYKNPKVGEQTKLVTVGVHFKNAFRGSDQNLASIDGIWQISDAPTEVKADTTYGKMTIKTVTADAITMDNKDNAITLSKNKDTELMPGVNIKTADNDTLRFYIYKPVTIAGAAAEVAPAVVAPPAAAANETVVVAPPAEAPKAEEKAVAENKTTENKTAEAPKAEAKKTPGFESIFAITGLLAVAYLVLGRRE